MPVHVHEQPLGPGRRETRGVRTVLLGAAVLLASFAVPPPLGWAAEALPPKLQATLTLRILAYHHGLAGREPGPVNVLLLQEAAGGGELLVALQGQTASGTVSGRQLRVVARTYTTPALLGAALAELRPVAVLVPAGLDGAAREIAELSRAGTLLSIGSSEASVRSGLALAVTRRGARPVILANLRTLRAAGVALDAALLDLCVLVPEPAP